MTRKLGIIWNLPTWLPWHLHFSMHIIILYYFHLHQYHHYYYRQKFRHLLILLLLLLLIIIIRILVQEPPLLQHPHYHLQNQHQHQWPKEWWWWQWWFSFCDKSVTTCMYSGPGNPSYSQYYSTSPSLCSENNKFDTREPLLLQLLRVIIFLLSLCLLLGEKK
jgi:hypothetical protein